MEHNNLLLQQQWLVIYTRARHEKVVHQELSERGIESFLPMMRQCRQWSDRKKWIDVPMFSSYLFVHPNPLQREQVLRVPGAVRYIMFNGRKAVVQDCEIAFLRRAQLQETQIEIVPQLYNKEQQVVITSGAFQGFKGRLLRSYSDGRIAVGIEEIGYSIIIQNTKEGCLSSDALHSEESVTLAL